MSTSDVPGARAANRDVLAMGTWAEHEDGSLIFVESVEGGTVVYSIFDVASDPVQEYRDAMPEAGFKAQFSWRPDGPTDQLRWTWHDKTPFVWDRVMANFPAGTRSASAVGTITAAQRVARSLNLRAGPLMEREGVTPQDPARSIMTVIRDALNKLLE